MRTKNEIQFIYMKKNLINPKINGFEDPLSC